MFLSLSLRSLPQSLPPSLKSMNISSGTDFKKRKTNFKKAFPPRPCRPPHSSASLLPLHSLCFRPVALWPPQRKVLCLGMGGAERKRVWVLSSSHTCERCLLSLSGASGWVHVCESTAEVWDLPLSARQRRILALYPPPGTPRRLSHPLQNTRSSSLKWCPLRADPGLSLLSWC